MAEMILASSDPGFCIAVQLGPVLLALQVNADTFSSDGNTFSKNTASDTGGAWATYTISNITFSNATFADNTASGVHAFFSIPNERNYCHLFLYLIPRCHC